MAFDFEKGTITLYGKTTKIDALIKKIASLSGSQLSGFFAERSIKLPRQINVAAMASVLSDKIKFLHSKSLSKEQFERLCYFKDYTEQQLEDLFLELASDRESFDQYRYNLARIIVANYAALDLNDGEFNYLKNVTKEKMESFTKYSTAISVASAECEGTFDGVALNVLEEVLPYSATIEEISRIMAKYGIDITDRLSKEEYQAYIEYALGDSLTGELQDELNDMSLASLSVFARRNDIDMQPSMDKRMMVAYVIYYLSLCDIPTTSILRIEIPDDLMIPEFTIDPDVIDPFHRDDVDAVKIVSYPGDEADAEALQQILDEVNQKQTEFIQFDEVENLNAPLAVGSVTESAPYVEESLYGDAKALEESIENAPEMSDEEINAMIEEANPLVVEEATPDPVELPLEVTANTEYGSKKLKNLGKLPVKTILFSVLGAVAAAAVIIVIYGLTR